MPHAPRFGIIRSFSIAFDEIIQQTLAFEAAGFDSLWGIDHFNRPTDPSAPLMESWTALAAIASRTSRIRLGILVTSNTFRHPALLAKEAATIDHISHGRLEIGIGAGGFEQEHLTFGLPYPAPGKRVDRLRESVEIVDALLRRDVTTFNGRFWQITEAPFRPGPVQRPRPPITIAGSGPRIVRLAARLANRWNGYGTPAETEANNRVIDDECAAIGRDPREVIRSLYLRSASLGFDPWASQNSFRDIFDRYAAVGIDEFIFEPPLEGQWETMQSIARDLLPELRRTRADG